MICRDVFILNTSLGDKSRAIVVIKSRMVRDNKLLAKSIQNGQRKTNEKWTQEALLEPTYYKSLFIVRIMTLREI